MQVTSLILVVLVDGPLAEDVDRGPDSLEVGVWLLVGCFAAATFLSWLWSGRYVKLISLHDAHEHIHYIACCRRCSERIGICQNAASGWYQLVDRIV